VIDMDLNPEGFIEQRDGVVLPAVLRELVTPSAASRTIFDIG